MADDVGVNQTASYTVAADVSGTVAYQRVKIQLGADGTFSGDVGPTNPVPISGTVQVSGPVQVSGAVSISAMPAVSGTISVSNTVVISGAVSISVMPAVSGLVSVTGVSLGVVVSGVVSISVMPAVSISVSAVLGTIVTVLGTLAVSQTTVVSGVVSISVMPAVSISVSAVLGTVITVLGTLAVSQTTVVSGLVSVTGVSLGVVVSGTVSISGAAGGGATTTAPPSISEAGQIVWIAGGQGTTANPVFISGTVTAGAGTTVVSVTGTVLVQPLYSTTAAPGAAATGEIVWVANPATVTVSVSISQTVSILNVVPVTTQTSVSVTGLPVWWQPGALVGISVSQALGTIVTVLAANVSVSAVAASLVFGTIIRVSNVASATVITVLGTVSVSNVLNVYTAVSATSASTGQIVISKDFARSPVQIMISSTVVGSSTTVLMTVYAGNTQLTAGASFWVPGAGRVFRVHNMYMVAVSSAVVSAPMLAVLLGTAAASLSVTATVGIQAVLPYMPAATAVFNMGDMSLDGPAGATTVAVGIIGGTSHTIQAAVIIGYLMF